MVTKVIRFFGKTVGNMHEAAYLLGFFALISQVLALVRDRIFAHTFGASATLDVYYAAFRIPDFLFVGIASMASLFVLIPFLSRSVKDDVNHARMFLSSVTSVFFITMVLVAGIVFLFADPLTQIAFPGIVGADHADLVLLTRILLLSPLLLGLSNILASVTQVFKKFVVYAVAPVLYNIGIIIGVLFFYPSFGIQGLAYGVVLGALLHVLVQVPTVLRAGLMPLPMLRIQWNAIWDVVRVSLPRTLALSMSQVALFVLVALASRMSEGSITVFNFAFNLQSAPLAIVGVSYSVAAFPTLAQLFAHKKIDDFRAHITTAARHILFWSFPIMILVIVLRAQIVRTVLGSGAFSWADTRLTAAALALFVVSLAAHGLMLLFVRGYYAAGKTWRPFVVNTISAVVIICGAWWGIHVVESSPQVAQFIDTLLRVEDVPGTLVLVLPLAYAVGMILNAIIFWILFARDFGGRLPRALHKTVGESLSAAFVGGVVAYLGLQLFDTVFNLDTLLGVFLHGAVAGVTGIIVMVFVLLLLGNKEIQNVIRRIFQINSMSYSVREPSVDDVDDIKDIYKSYIVKEEVVNHLVERVNQYLSQDKEAIQTDLKYLVATDGSRVVGLIGFRKPHEKLLPFTRTDNPIELYTFFIYQRRKGVGRKLLKNMLEISRLSGYKEIVLYSGNQWKDSWCFYDKMGFERAGTLESPTEGTAQIFQKNL